MTYGFRPENWSAFEHELRVRGIEVADIEKIEMRPNETEGSAGTVVIVTLRSGRTDAWRHEQAETLE